MSSKLEPLRRELDELDSQFTDLLTKRMEVCRRVSAVKREEHLPVYDPAREAQVLSGARKAAGPYGWEAQQLFTLLMSLSRRRQRLESIPRISLIGMPGCGKTTVGRLLAEMTGYEFIDTDEEVKRMTGSDAGQLILSAGEAYFRSLETEALKSALRKTRAVIATGGGIVLSEENRSLLRAQSRVCCLSRPTALLSTQDRPLSQASSLEELFRVRNPLYIAAAHFTADASRSPLETAQAIIDRLTED